MCFIYTIEHTVRHYFDIDTTADTQHVPYDYGSLMHYGRTAFSTIGLPTVVPKQTDAVIGQLDHLSANDKLHINIRYCPGEY